MKKLIFIVALVVMLGVVDGQETQRQRLEQHLYTLASDSLRGREAGTDDGRRAADYILRQWREMGLNPLFDDGYTMPFAHVAGN